MIPQVIDGAPDPGTDVRPAPRPPLEGDMRRFAATPVRIAAVVAITAIAGVLGYEGGRVAEYRRALAAAENAGAALEGALGACRARVDGDTAPAAEREVADLTLG
jgi:hypothetical protein